MTFPPKTIPPGVRLVWDNHTSRGGFHLTLVDSFLKLPRVLQKATLLEEAIGSRSIPGTQPGELTFLEHGYNKWYLVLTDMQ
jgi:hypothetical protein